MTSPQKKYIITEAQIMAQETLLRHKLSDLRSQPYKSSKKVLDVLEQYDFLVQFFKRKMVRKGDEVEIRRLLQEARDQLKEELYCPYAATGHTIWCLEEDCPNEGCQLYSQGHE